MLGVANSWLCKVIYYCAGSNGTKILFIVYVYRIAGCPLLRVLEEICAALLRWRIKNFRYIIEGVHH